MAMPVLERVGRIETDEHEYREDVHSPASIQASVVITVVA
jgi:hypothetical protein